MEIKALELADSVEFELIHWKIRNATEFKQLSDNEVDIAISEYKRFLSLRVENPKIDLAPTKLMDIVWHYHIIDTRRYATDCQRLFGSFLHHKPSYGPNDSAETEVEMKDSFDRKKNLYQKKNGTDPISISASCGTDSDGSACGGVSCCSG